MSDNKNSDQFISEKFLEQIKEDLKIDEFNLIVECRNAINITQKYLEYYYQQKRKLNKLKTYLSKVEGEKFNYFKNEFEINITSSQDIQKFINKDGKYLNAKDAVDEQSALVEFLEGVVKQFNGRQWMIKNIIEVKKIENI